MGALVSTVASLIVKLWAGPGLAPACLAALSWRWGPGLQFYCQVTSHQPAHNIQHITHRPLQWTSPHILITAYNTHACALLLSLVWGWWWLVPVLPLCPVTARCKVNTRCNGQLQKWQNWNFMGNVKTKFLRVLAFSLKNPIWDKIHNWTNNAEPTSDPNSFLLLN